MNSEKEGSYNAARVHFNVKGNDFKFSSEHIPVPGNFADANRYAFAIAEGLKSAVEEDLLGMRYACVNVAPVDLN